MQEEKLENDEWTLLEENNENISSSSISDIFKLSNASRELHKGKKKEDDNLVLVEVLCKIVMIEELVNELLVKRLY